MKRLIAAVVLTILVVTLAVSSSLIINRHHRILTEVIEETEKMYRKGESTEQQLSALLENWEKTEPVLMFFANHDSVEEIGIRINRLVSIAQTQTGSLFLSESAELKTRLDYLKDSESLTFESVF